MHKLNVDNTVQWELLMLKLSLSIFSVNLETTWSPPNMLVTVLFHLNKNAKVTVIRKQTPRHKAQLIWNIMLKIWKNEWVIKEIKQYSATQVKWLLNIPYPSEPAKHANVTWKD